MSLQNYRIFSDDDSAFGAVNPAIKTVVTYAEHYMKWAPVTVTRRAEICTLMGWDKEVIEDEVQYMEYQKQRATLLFPDQADRIENNFDNLNVAEVDRAEANFSESCQIPFSRPEDSLKVLNSFLGELIGNTGIMEALNLTTTTETDSQQ